MTMLGAALALLAPTQAQAGAVQTSGVNAQVLEEIQFAVLLDMDFGKVISNGSAGVLDLSPNAGRSCDPGLICTGTSASSQLRLTGSDASVQVNFSPTFLLNGPGVPMVAEPQFPGGPGAVVQLTGGETVVNFGAKLYVNANQAPGTYSGSFSVYLEYN